LRSLDTPTLTVLNFKLKIVGDRSFCSVGLKLWCSLPYFRRAGALACGVATTGTVAALLRLYLLANHFGGLLFNLPLLLPSSVEQVVVRKLADGPQGSEHVIKNPPR